MSILYKKDQKVRSIRTYYKGVVLGQTADATKTFVKWTRTGVTEWVATTDLDPRED